MKRRLLATGVAAVAAATLTISVVPANAAQGRPTAPVSLVADPAMPAMPTMPATAVAMGDSFISGEGAGAYQPVTDQAGVAQGFPGWSAPNSNAFFCHRSANASINVASLPGIDRRVNLACSGAQPADMTNPSSARPAGRTVAAQIAQLNTVMQTNDVDVVLLGIGSNNSQFTFGGLAAECAGRFVADGYTGWWEVWLHFSNWVTGKELREEACTDADFPGAAALNAARSESANAVLQVLDALEAGDADGQHRIVLQDYTNPLPQAFAPQYHTEDGRSDTRDKYRALVDERYAAGCPTDMSALAPAHRFSANLGSLVSGVASTVRSQRPAADVVYVNVQGAFNGARLCENPGSPNGSLATPLRVMDGPTGVVVQSFTPFDKLDIKRVTDTCKAYYQTCQETWHPNAAGHQALGQCLSGAFATTKAAVVCTRQPGGGITVS